MADTNQLEDHFRSISKLREGVYDENSPGDRNDDPYPEASSPNSSTGPGIQKRIFLRDGGPNFWLPGEPFFVMHGWVRQPRVSAPGMVDLFRFELELDGQLLREDYRLSIPYPPNRPIWLDRYWIYNFPEGLTGDHTFTLHYFGPCLAYGGDNYYLPPNRRNEVVEVETRIVLVHFVSLP